MSKALKIAGITLGSFIGLIIFYVLIQSVFLGNSREKNIDSFDAGVSSGPFRKSGPAPSESSFNAPSSPEQTTINKPNISDTSSTDYPETDKKIIKNGNLNLKVDNTDQASVSISKIAKDNGGEVASSNFYQSGTNVKSGNMTIRVPMVNFEKTFSDLKKVASLVISESTSGADVTEQYVDLQAQLKNRQSEEEAFTRIMTQAQKIDDILAVQRELSRVRGQIEQLQGRIKYLETQTDMSTIEVNLTEDANISIVDKWRPWQVVKESASILVKKVQGFVDFLIRLVILILPILILYGLLIFVIYKIGKKVYHKFRKKDQGQA